MYDVYEIRKDFTNLNEKINGKPNTFLDTAASAQKPISVLEAMCTASTRYYANVHRGVYYLSEKITIEYEKARKKVQEFINAAGDNEIIFTRSATESINLVAATWGCENLKPGDEILISEAEHHANLVPWQMLKNKKGCTLRVFKINADGSYNHEEFKSCLSSRTKLVAVTAMSNVLGTIFPIKKIISEAHKIGAKCLVDAGQSAARMAIDVQDLDCDFLVFSGHKTYGPTGIGVLYGKYDILDSMPPYQTGGDMVDKVTYDTTTFAPPPARFEAGTPAIVQAIGLAAAIDYMQNLGMDNIFKHEQELTKYTIQKLKKIEGLEVIGNAKDKGGVFSFALDNIHPQDLAFILDKEGVAVRTGHHCAEPLVNRMGYKSLARASLGLYSTTEDIDNFLKALQKVKNFF